MGCVIMNIQLNIWLEFTLLTGCVTLEQLHNLSGMNFPVLLITLSPQSPCAQLSHGHCVLSQAGHLPRLWALPAGQSCLRRESREEKPQLPGTLRTWPPDPSAAGTGCVLAERSPISKRKAQGCGRV